MHKRQFLTSVAAALIAWPAHGAAKPAARPSSPALLTVTGAIGRTNRGSSGALDQMMHKQMIRFDKAYVFDFAAIAALASVAIRPTLEYDGQPHWLAGPLLTDVQPA